MALEVEEVAVAAQEVLAALEEGGPELLGGEVVEGFAVAVGEGGNAGGAVGLGSGGGGELEPEGNPEEAVAARVGGEGFAEGAGGLGEGVVGVVEETVELGEVGGGGDARGGLYVDGCGGLVGGGVGGGRGRARAGAGGGVGEVGGARGRTGVFG